MTGGVLLCALTAAVLPLKPPLSPEARRHPGPTVIRAGALQPRDFVRERALARQEADCRARQLAELAETRRQANELARNMERMTVDDLTQHQDVLKMMKDSGQPAARIEEMRTLLDTTVETIRAEGRELRRELRERGLEDPPRKEVPKP